MNWLPIVLGTLAAALAVGSVVLALGWARTASLLAQCRAAMSVTEREAEGSAADLADVRASLDRALAELGQARETLAEERGRAMAIGREHQANLQAEQRVSAERLAAAEKSNHESVRRIAELDQQMRQTFGALAGDALRQSTTEFLKLASEKLGSMTTASRAELDERRKAVDELVRPIGEALKKTEEKLGSLDRQNAAAFAGLSELKSETAKLARALARPEVRGRYGEIQLRRVAELAGMTAYCDFEEQASQRDAEGRLLRPDMVVHLPNQRLVAIDAKTNTDAYVQAASAPTPEAQEELLRRFADQVSDQVTKLSRKGYWKEFDGSPDFVVMFVPGDQFLDAALARRPDLLDRAAEQNVILASPSTLIALLRAVAVGWREQRFAEAATELLELGRVLHERAANVLEHAASVGKSLNDAVERYNRFVGSWENRLTPTLRKFEETGARSGKELAPLPKVETRAAAILLFEAGETEAERR